MNFNIKNLYLAVIGLFLIAVTCCTKSNDDPTQVDPSSPTTPTTPSTAVSITTISPTHGLPGTVDTINGANFSLTASDNFVTYNAYQAEVLSASATQLIVKTPIYSNTGPVAVKVGNNAVANGPAFTYELGMVTTIAGTAGTRGYQDGTGASVRFQGLNLVTFDRNGNLYAADGTSIRKVTSDGVVTTFAGGGSEGYQDGNGKDALFKGCAGMAFDSKNNLYVSDIYNYVIRKITPDGTVSTFAGNTYPSNFDGLGKSAGFNKPSGIAIDENDNIYVADEQNSEIRKITPDGMVTTIVGHGFPDTSNGVGTAAGMDFPTGLAFDRNGNLYVSEGGNDIRKITPDLVVTRIAGNRYAGPGTRDGYGPVASLNAPAGMDFDAEGYLYIADVGSNSIRRISPTDMVNTVANFKTYNGAIDGSTQVAQFDEPTGVAVDKAGNIYVADAGNGTIRNITLH